MKKLVFLSLIFASSFLNDAISRSEGDYVCTVRVRNGEGNVVIATASSDVSYQDACKKAYALAMAK